ncbi:biotin/lipoyl-containing protein [Microbaculum marinisediminis]|uniref:Biotin/lipoyl-binding protein n=1 Tax=Microbaculum marinisediminis TaxID=2931392 RepID=A0AAW5R486_9HYPH|nr:biotin/lipoyl-containing protein [Microbaculum sp. A6E488]MCT8974212.1 biotin/lipoyl-binding protein [Microbaculum sp. A6E488]
MANEEVLAPVSGSVWKVECTVGQDVNEGDILMILESMKMEIPVEAPATGKVSSLTVAEGDAVDEDAVLGVIAK